MSDTVESAGTFETRADAGKGAAGVVTFWLSAIEIAGKEEASWRADAEETEGIYSGGRGEGNAANRRRFNILYANTETLAAAIYNSTPVPDVRRRFNDDDPAGKQAATLIERCLNFSLDEYDVDATFRAVAQGGLVPGRGIVRVRYTPVIADNVMVYESVSCEAVDWRTFRRGPAKVWKDVPWIAFQHYLTRNEIKKLNPGVGATINLDSALPHSDDGSDGRNVSDLLKRGEVWEIWDKDKREVIFVAPSHRAEPLMVVADPLRLADFFPVPRPLQPMDVAGSLVPVEPYRLYYKMADELEELTRRISSLTSAIKWRGAYSDAALGDFLSKFEGLDDGEMAPIDNPMAAAGGMDKAFWFQPVGEAAKVLLQLYAAREQTKQSIYEITGISDLLRGSSVASETATAQGIKAQWGSLRISSVQSEMQRLARDVLRLKTEIIAEKFSPQTLQAMSGMQLDQETLDLLKNDPLRRYRVDVETDSTIRADLARQQQNISGFVAGFGSFIQAVGPAVQAGALPMPVVAEMVKSFSRTFKLGRSVEESLDQIPTQAPPQADPQAAEAQAAQAAQQEGMKAQMAVQMEQGKVEAAMKLEEAKTAATIHLKQMDIDAENQRTAMKASSDQQLATAKLELEREKMMMEHDLKIAEYNLKMEHARATLDHDDRRFVLDERVAESGASATGADLRPKTGPSTHEVMGQIAEAMKEQTAATYQLMQGVTEAIKAMSAPKRILRDENNKAIGVSPMEMQ